MNKRGLIKIGMVGIFLLMTSLMIIVIFLTTQSIAVILKDSYMLGEKVKINLEDVENYKLKIITPSTSYIIEGSKEIFTFNPEEAGIYTVVLQTIDKKEE